MDKLLRISLFPGFKRDIDQVKNNLTARTFTMLFLFFGAQLFAQIPGNPYVDAGPDQTVDCSTGGCADLSAVFLQIGETNTYTVSSIDFLPPSDFQGLGNQLNANEDDKWTGVNQLPFDFCFFGDINTQYQVGTNGVIRFDVDAGDTYNNWSFSADLPNNVQEALAEGNIFSPVHDIDPARSTTEEIGFEVQGEAPNRVLIVSYSEVPMFQCNDILATQMIVLYETTNIIDIYILQKQSCTTWQNGVAAVGIQNNAGTTAFVPPGRNTSDSPWETFLEAWRFTPAGPSIVDFAWLDSTGAVVGTTPNLTVCPVGSETYTARVTYTSCNGDIVVVTDDVVVSSSSTFSVSLGPDISTCTETSAVLTAELNGLDPADATFLWNTGAITQSITVTTDGTYFVDVTGTNGCTIRDTIEVSFGTGPIINLGDDITTCFLQSVILDATPSNFDPALATYIWFFNGVIIPGETNVTLVATQPGTYAVNVMGDGCEGTDTIVIEPTEFTVDLGEDLSSCFDEIFTLTSTLTVFGNDEATYQWFFNGNVIAGETNSTIDISGIGTYMVIANVGSCEATDTVLITPTEFTINLGEDIQSCFEEPVTLVSTLTVFEEADATYQWLFNGNIITGETNSTLDISEIGSYMVIATVGNCEATDEIVISPTEFTIDLGEDFGSCFDGPVILTSTLTVFEEADATYQWLFNGVILTGETNSTLTILLDGSYTVIASVGNCEATDTILVSPGDLTVDLGEDIESCFENDTVLLTANAQGVDLTNALYTWFLNGAEIAGENEATILVSGPATYSVVVMVGNCQASDEVVISLVDFNVDLGVDFDSCFDGQTTLNAALTVYDETDGTFEWYLNGSVIADETSASLIISQPGEYTVIVNVGLCNAQDSITVTASDPLTVNAGDDVEVCPNEEVVLTASTSEEGVTYQWFLNGDLLPNETNASITVSLDGETIGGQIYSVTISTGSCTGTDSVEVILYNGGNCVISQGISPNGDNLNDSFDLAFLKNKSGKLNLQVFNRLGKMVFELDNYTDEWRGQSDNGKDLPTGTYYYVLNITSIPGGLAGNGVVTEDQKTGWIYLNQEAN